MSHTTCKALSQSKVGKDKALSLEPLKMPGVGEKSRIIVPYVNTIHNTFDALENTSMSLFHRYGHEYIRNPSQNKQLGELFSPP